MIWNINHWWIYILWTGKLPYLRLICICNLKRKKLLHRKSSALWRRGINNYFFEVARNALVGHNKHCFPTTLISLKRVKTIEVYGKIAVKNICTLTNKPLWLVRGWDVNVCAWVCMKDHLSQFLSLKYTHNHQIIFFYIISHIILAFWLVLTNDLLVDTRADDFNITNIFPLFFFF